MKKHKKTPGKVQKFFGNWTFLKCPKTDPEKGLTEKKMGHHKKNIWSGFKRQ